MKAIILLAERNFKKVEIETILVSGGRPSDWFGATLCLAGSFVRFLACLQRDRFFEAPAPKLIYC